MLREQVGLSDEEVEALVDGNFSRFDERERAVLNFATQVARDPRRVTDDHVDALRAVGYDDAAIVRLLLVTTAAISANTIADALDVLPADREAPFR